MTRHFAKFLYAGLLLAAAPLQSQDTTTARRDSTNVTVLDITVDPAVNEPHIVFFQKGIVYRASFSGPGIVIRMRSYSGKQLPFIVALSGVDDASGASEFEIYPQAAGDVELTAVFNAGQVPVRFRIWNDVRATERGRRSAEEGYWELGVDGLVGWHGDFSGNSSLLAASPMIGGCFSVRNGPGPLGFINGCIVGVEGIWGDEAHGYFGLFTEPHLRLSNGRRTDQGWRLEWGGVVRYAAYAAGDGGNLGDGGIGVGAYLARDKRDLNGRGWRYTLVLRADRVERIDFDGLGIETGHSDHFIPAVQLQIGRYR